MTAASKDITEAAAEGISSLFHIDPLVTVLVLSNLALVWLARYLIQRNERQSDKITNALVNNTAALIALKEVIHAKNG